MPFRYAPLPTHTSVQDRELEASFDTGDSDIEDHETDAQAESRPLNRLPSRSPPPTASGTALYNFEDLDYDYPPPGSPPRPSTFALPNNRIGNSNGRLPQSPHIPPSHRSGWFHRLTGGILPVSSLRGSTNTSRPIGGGTENDGVFANINAKPGRGRMVEDGENGIYVLPEEVQKEQPPSYATAQADAVPPYWETTVHAPATLGIAGEIMVDGLHTGSFFSFLWNLLISMSFQFIGFLLTFLLHSTHAGKLGSRAGLGITLIHYGFYFRTRVQSYNNNVGVFSSDGDIDGETPPWWPSSTGAYSAKPTFGTAAEAENYYGKNTLAANGTLLPSPTIPVVVKPTLSVGTTEWISFLLMTVGWFIFLTSTLSFWRVKRWERSMLANTPVETSAGDGPSHAHSPFHALARFGFPGTMWRGLRGDATPREDELLHEEEAMIESNGDPENLERAGRYAQARATESRLEEDLRRAGLL